MMYFRVYFLAQAFLLIVIALFFAFSAHAAPSSWSPYCWSNAGAAPLRPLAAACGYPATDAGVVAMVGQINMRHFKRYSDLHKLLPCLPDSNVISSGRDTSRYLDFYRTQTTTGGLLCEIAASEITVCSDSRLIFSHDTALCDCPSGSTEDGETGVCVTEGEGGGGDVDSSLVFYAFLFLVGAVSACAFVLAFSLR